LTEYPEYVARNVQIWTKTNAEYTGPQARDAWTGEMEWSLFGIPESELGVLGEVDGLDVVDLGCGTAYFSAWLARRGARPVGVDPTPAQLETARTMQVEFGLEFPLVEAAAEDVPLPDASFDLAVSQYGASIWADPYRWVAEAARLLRPGGRLAYLVNSCLILMCMPDEETVLPAEERLLRPYFGMHRFEWRSDESINFGLTHGEWIRLLRDSGLTVERLIEIQAPEGPAARPGDLATREWARQWPPEEIWVARKQ
jgi:SAM-dependent methyltransferase